MDRSQTSNAVILPVKDLTELDLVFASSSDQATVLFLHDPYCPVSTRARARVEEAGGDIHLVDVSRQHDMNKAIAERTGIRHESPQVLILWQGKSIWFASHGGISTQGITIARGF